MSNEWYSNHYPVHGHVLCMSAGTSDRSEDLMDDNKENPVAVDRYEETLVEMIVAFTELIDRIDRALPNSPFKTYLLEVVKSTKREVTTHVIETLKDP